MSLFGNSLVHADLRDNSMKAIYDLFNEHYQVRYVQKSYGDRYNVYLKDGSILTVGVGIRSTILGEERPFVKYIN